MHVGRIEVMFDEQGLVPAVLQDAATDEVLMVAWMNEEALRLTQETGEAHFWSRSREVLWRKGETSGNVMRVREMRVDCDRDTLLVRVDPAGPACHTDEESCFYRHLGPWLDDAGQPRHDGSVSLHSVRGDEGRGQRVASRGGGKSPAVEGRDTLEDLFAVILDRRERQPTGSYTSALFQAGEDEVLKKVGEEAMEVVLAAKGESDGRLISEVADLTYHLLVLLALRGLAPADVAAELERRRR